MTTADYLFYKCGGDKYFSTIDLSKGYWQIRVAEDEISKTALSTQDGKYECLKMPFGMINSGATLKRAVKKLLDGMAHSDSYVDDILVHTPT